MGNQQGTTVQHRELCPILCGSLDRRGAWGRMDTHICMAESLHNLKKKKKKICNCIPVSNLVAHGTLNLFHNHFYLAPIIFISTFPYLWATLNLLSVSLNYSHTWNQST